MSTPVVRLARGQGALFGYGSLCSITSLERTLGHPYEGPYPCCQVEGWRRTWDVGNLNQTYFFETPAGRVYPERILYLNVRPKAGSRLNGVLFVVNAAELEGYDRRELIYDRQPITSQLRGVEVTGGDAYLYVAKPECLVRAAASPGQAAIRRSYLNIMEDAFRDLGEEFRAAYQRSSDEPPAHLIIDDRRDDSEP
ncbi:MAG: gamma-glutamylcyclotransferase [Bryobacterales bacterium]|nr:gamma-glutamylcyclotransferase [Bryobacterales bacterium]